MKKAIKNVSSFNLFNGAVKNEKGLIAIYLFGSASEGKKTPLSDIDICVIGDFSDEQKQKISRDFSEGYDVSFFDELPVWIKIRVFKGKLLFVRNRKKLYEINFRTLAEYDDFRPLIQKMILRRFGNARP